MIPAMTHSQLIRRLREACNEAGSQTAYAQALGVRPQFVSNVLAGRRDPSRKLLKALGLERVVRKTVSYQPIRQAAE